MTAVIAAILAALISLIAVGGAWHARRSGRPDALVAFYVTLSIAASVLASKTIAFDFGFATAYAPGAVLIFAVTFLLTDIVNEKFGRAETQRMIVLAFLAQIAFLLFSFLVLKAAPAPFFANQAAFEAVFGSVPRNVAAGLIAFLISENVDAYLFQWFRNLTRGRHLWMRNVLSSLPAMAIDSAVFVTLAFAGLMPVVPLILGLTLTKWLVGIVDIPFMYAARAALRERR